MCRCRIHRVLRLVFPIGVAWAGVGTAQAAPPRPQALEEVPWRPSGPGLEIAIVDGDPSVAGQPFTMLLRLANGAWIGPHTHNVAKRLLVVSGALLVGHGTVLDSAQVPVLAGFGGEDAEPLPRTRETETGVPR